MDVPKVGSLLLATPELAGTFFECAVIVMLEYDENGALGIVLNKLAQIELGQALPGWDDLSSVPQRLFHGGPVSENGAMCLAIPKTAGEEPPGWRRIHGELGSLHLDTPIPIVEGAYSNIRVFAGYSGWSGGQLDRELEEGSWYVVPGSDLDVFDHDPTTLWRRVLRRQGGELALVSTWIPDAARN